MSFTSRRIDDFEIFRSNTYHKWKSPSGKTLLLNKQPYLDVVVTDRCNRNCGFCIANLVDKKDECNVETFHQQIDWAIRNMQVKEVLVVGGEPTIAKNLFPILNILYRYCKGGMLKKVCMTTNGDRFHRGGELTDFATRFAPVWPTTRPGFVTHLNLSVMNTCQHAQHEIAGHKGRFLSPDVLNKLRGALLNVMLRVNANSFRGNLDTVDKIVRFYREVAPHCDSVKISPLLKVDDFSVMNVTTQWVRDHILPPEKYEALFTEIENALYEDVPLVRNQGTFGFVEYSMLCMDTPLILNYNHRNRMAQMASQGHVNNVKLLTNGNLSLSWNKDDEDKVVRKAP